MAAKVDVSVNPRSLFSDKTANFEEVVKDKLTWSRKMWNESGEMNSSFHKMVNSVKYWGGTLKKAHGKFNVVVGLFNEQRKVNVSLMDFVDEFDRMGVGHKLIGFTNFRNPRYLSFHFDTPLTKKYVEDNLKKIGDSYVVFLDWALFKPITIVKFHWVPLDFEMEELSNFLASYGKIEEWVREEHKLMDGRLLKNGTVSFKILIKEEVDIKKIPHLCVLSGLELLINISGRQIMCLNCNGLGHKSSECPTPYCATCRKMQNKVHKCVTVVGKIPSYASVVNNNDSNELVEAIKEGASGLSSKLSWNRKSTVTVEKEDLEKSEVNINATENKSDVLDGDLGKKPVLRNRNWADQMVENSDECNWKEYQMDSDDSEVDVVKLREYCNEMDKLKKHAELLNKVKDSKSLKELKKEALFSDSLSLATASDNLKRKLEKKPTKPAKVVASKGSGLVTKPLSGRRNRGGRGRRSKRGSYSASLVDVLDLQDNNTLLSE